MSGQYLCNANACFLYSCSYEETLRNSFRNEDVLKLFLQMLYQLLLCGRIPFKTRKMFCVGPSDSGKTTWLEPILQVLDEEKVGTCTDEGKFSTQMLAEDNQLCFIDEFNAGKYLIIHLANLAD